jgi:hypothetical protein
MSRSTTLSLVLAAVVGTAAMCLAAAPQAAQNQAAQTQTWVGKISDSMCQGSHKAMAGGKSDHDCALECIKAGNSYVFVNDKDQKVYKIANQKLKDLETHVGHDHVTISGSIKGDTITVAKVEMPKSK